MGGGALIRSSSHILVSHQKQHNQTAAGSRCSCQKRVSRISRTNPSTTNIVKHRIHLPLGSLRITEMQAAAILSIYPVSAALKGWQPLGAHLSRRSSYNSQWTIKSKFQKKLKTWKTNGILYINISFMKSDVALMPLSSIQFIVRDNQSSCKVPVQKAAIAGRSVYQGQILQQFLPQYLHPSSLCLRHGHPTFNRESSWWVYKLYPLP